MAAALSIAAFTIVAGSAAAGHPGTHVLPKAPHAKIKGIAKNPVNPVGRLLASVSSDSGFEASDGNLAPNDAIPPGADWNSFTPTWTGTAPYQTGTGSASGFSFFGVTDDSVTTTDTGFAGGVKQDDECPAVIGTKSPNKDDLARIYIAGKLASNGDTYLMLSWVRIPQNTTSADAHVGFEFNQGTTSCGSGGLVHRTAGDLLVVYDFTNGGTPTISISRWVTSGACEVGSDTAPCWGPETVLGPSVAEAMVNSGPVTDTALPGGGPATLGTNEFGEAGIDLTSAVFTLTGSRACQRFGTAYAVSRSSGSSSTAQMMDLVGPAPVDLSNCETPTISTVIKNAADDSTVSSALNVGSSVYDTSTVSHNSSATPTGTISYRWFTNSSCTGDSISAGTGKDVAAGTGNRSNTEGPLGAGTYGFQAMYVAGSDQNYNDSNWSACEPLTISAKTVTASTVLKNAAGDATITNGTTQTLGTSVYDTASVSGFVNGFNPTGTISYRFFNNADCSGSSVSAGTGKDVAAGTGNHSDTEGPLAAGSYGFQAQYVAGANDNYSTSAWSGCEPFSIGNKAVTASTVLHNAGDDSVLANGGTVGLGSGVYDTSSISGTVAGVTPTGTMSYRFFNQANCGGTPVAAGTGKDVAAGTGNRSDTESALAAGSYGFEAQYVAGANDSYTTSDWSSCEPFTVSGVKPTVATALKNAADDSALANSGHLPLGSSVYDTAVVSGLVNGVTPTGTLNYRFFANSTCTGSSTAAGSSSSLTAHSDTKGPLGAGNYAFQAQYLAGTNDSYSSSDWSPCEPFTIDVASITASTALKNAADNTAVDNGATLPLNSSLYDTASLTGPVQGFTPSGTLSFRFFSNGTCSGESSTAAGSAIALDGHSTTEGPLSVGSYGFEAMYVAGANDNYSSSAWSSCEPFTIAPGSVTVTTTLENAAGNVAIANGSSLPLSSSVYDTAALSGTVAGKAATGTISYRFFTGGDCSVESSASAGTSIALDGQSNTEGPLAAGNYAFQAMYVAGANDNYTSSVWSDCEPFTIAQAVPSAATTLKNAADNSTVSNGSTLGFNSSVYDTASIGNENGFPLTGTVTFRFFTNNTCSGSPSSVQPGVALGGNSNASGALGQGGYAFQAMYVAGSDANHADSAWSACEPFNIAAAPFVPPPPPPSIDLAITKAGSPASSTIGDQIVWSMTVTNNGPDTATGVNVADPLPVGTTFVSATSTQGTCTGGAVVNCAIGTLGKGASITITLITTSTATGQIANKATVVGNEAESNTANNTASAQVQVVGKFVPPPTYCTALAVSPKQMIVGKTHILTIRVSQHGKAIPGVKVRISGSTLSILTSGSNAKGIVKRTVKPMKAGIVTFVPVAHKGCSSPRVGVIGVFTPPVTG